jgi:hypothetical protein
MDGKLAELLLAPETATSGVKAHVAECDECRKKLEELRATMALMDSWEAPEPSPYFMTRMNALLDEARQEPRAGWLERLRARIVYGPQMHVRPVAAMALTVVLLLGGGAYLGVSNWDQPAPAKPGQTAVVQDLQLLDNNAQVLDQLEAISGNEN